DQFSVARHPLAVLDVADGLPTREGLAVEDGDRRGPSLGHGPLQFGSAHARDLRSGSLAVFFDAGEFVAGSGEVPGGGRSARGGFGEGENQVSAIHLGSGQRTPRSATRLETALQLAVFFGDFHPLREWAAGLRRDGQVPAARIGALLGRGGCGQSGKEYGENVKCLHFRSV